VEHHHIINRRTFLETGLESAWAAPVIALVQRRDQLDDAADILRRAVETGQVKGAVLYVRHRKDDFVRSYGAARSPDALFLLGSISKPMTATALMTLYDQGKFRLDDPVRKFLHVSGLPDQLPENEALRSRHAPLSDFVARAVRTPLLFEPGSRYGYSSLAILLASEIGRRIRSTEFPALVEEAVFRPLGMTHSALGLGRFPLEATMRCQAEDAAPESGAGNPSAKEWDWNSSYWRRLGAPWGGVHASAPDVGRLLAEFLHQDGKAVRPDTARLMIRNHNPDRLPPRGLGFAVGTRAGSPGCSGATFGHSGSTGTLAWADPRTETICVVLTTLPAGSGRRHPRSLVSDRVAEAVA
jgi:CubicO group peptidase (beta-lactamase class C family)